MRCTTLSVAAILAITATGRPTTSATHEPASQVPSRQADTTTNATTTTDALSWDLPEYLKLNELYGAPDNDFACRSDRNPVVLLHGLSANREVDLNMLQKALAARGYCTFSLTYGAHALAPWIGGLASMRDSASQIAAFVREVYEKTNNNSNSKDGGDGGSGQQQKKKKVDIVGHSEGGVHALYVPLTQDGVAALVERTVALGPAVHGARYYGFTDLWYVGGEATRRIAGAVVKALGCAACDDMATGGAVYEDFRVAAAAAGTEGGGGGGGRGIVPEGVKATVVMSRYDTLVAPEVSAVEEEGVRNVFVQDACPDDRVGHAGLMWDRSVWGLVFNALEEEYDRAVECDKGLEI